MKNRLLFVFLFFIVTIGQAQDVSSAIIYQFDQVKQQYLPQAKYIYDYDDDDKSRLRAYDKFNFSEGEATWVKSQHLVRDFNEHNHLVHSVWANYTDGLLKNSTDKKYNISYDGLGEIIEITEDRYNEQTDTRSSKVLAENVLNSVIDYRPIYNRYTPAYLAEHGFDLQYDENNKLVYGQVSSCRLQEYHFTYGLDGRAVHVVINRICSTGQMEKRSKVMLIYENASKTDIGSDITFSAFPNPTIDLVSIQLNRSTSEIQALVLTDLYGRAIRTFSVDAFQIEKKIDMSDMAAGIYLLSAEASGFSTQLVKVD